MDTGYRSTPVADTPRRLAVLGRRMTNPPLWEVLEGLPVYGPMAVPFSATGQGTHREGLVVRFSPVTGTWVGNFQRGLTSLDDVCAHPDGRHVVVVAGGTAYLVDVETRTLVAHFGAQIEQVLPVPANGYVLVGNGLCLRRWVPRERRGDPGGFPGTVCETYRWLGRSFGVKRTRQRDRMVRGTRSSSTR
jgi:hypothetical protein